MIKLCSYNGNAHMGVFCVANERMAFIPYAAPDSLLRDVREALEVDVYRMSVAGTSLLGTLISMNSNGAVVTNMASDRDIDAIAEHTPIYRIGDRLNASGNNILTNDHAALVNPDIGKRALKCIEETLRVEVVRGTISEIKTVGSAAVVTNEGLLCHPQTPQERLKELSDLFKVPAAIGTLNYGAPLVGACVIGNTKGAAVGNTSTPIELGRLEDSLGYI